MKRYTLKYRGLFGNCHNCFKPLTHNELSLKSGLCQHCDYEKASILFKKVLDMIEIKYTERIDY